MEGTFEARYLSHVRGRVREPQASPRQTKAAFTRRRFHSKTAQFDTGYAVRLHVSDDIQYGYAVYPITFVSDNLGGVYTTPFLLNPF